MNVMRYHAPMFGLHVVPPGLVVCRRCGRVIDAIGYLEQDCAGTDVLEAMWRETTLQDDVMMAAGGLDG